VTEILAAVVKSGVNLDLLPANIHSRVREVIIRCLQKEQRKRYPEIGQAQYEIEQVLADPSGVFVQPVTTAKPRKKLRVGIAWVAATFVLGLIAAWLLKPAPPPEPKQVIRLDYHLPEDQELGGWNYGSFLAISPDGAKIVYVANQQLYLKNSHELIGFDLLEAGGRNCAMPPLEPADRLLKETSYSSLLFLQGWAAALPLESGLSSAAQCLFLAQVILQEYSCQAPKYPAQVEPIRHRPLLPRLPVAGLMLIIYLFRYFYSIPDNK